MGSDWPSVKLLDVLETIIDYRGKTPPKSVTGIPTLSAASVKGGRVRKDKVSFISRETYDKVTTRGFPQKGDVLITTEAPCGEVAPFPTDRVYHITRRIMSLRGDPKLIDSDFLLYTLFSSVCQDQLFSRVRGTTVPRVLKTDITGLKFGLPPLSTQVSIGHFLSSIDKKIELNRQINETLEQMAQALFKSWFVDFDPVIDKALAAGNPIPNELQDRAQRRQQQLDRPDHKPLPDDILQLFPSEFELTEELGWVPLGWSASNVGSCFNVIMGQSPPGHTYNKDGVGVPFFQGKTDFNFRFPLNRVYCTEPKRLAESGDTLVSVRAPVGDINIAAEDCCIGRGVAAARHKSQSISFTYYSMAELRENFKVFEGEGTVFGSINQRDFNTLPHVEPNRQLVLEFERLAGSIDHKIELNVKNISELTKLRDTLLPKLISGELRLTPEALCAKTKN